MNPCVHKVIKQIYMPCVRSVIPVYAKGNVHIKYVNV